MDKEKIEEQFQSFRNLHQYRKYSDEKLREIAFIKVVKKTAEIDSLFVNETDKNSANELFDKYMGDHVPETISDVYLLRSVIYLEVFNSKLQDKLNKFDDLDDRTIINLNNLILNNLDKILDLKKTLGLTNDKKNQDGSLDKKITLMKKQFKLWLNQNPISRYRTCPHCGKDILFRMKMDKWDVEKHPFFKDRILHNEELIQAYLKSIAGEKIIVDKNFCCRVLQCPTDYFDWLIKRFPKKGLKRVAKKALKEEKNVKSDN